MGYAVINFTEVKKNGKCEECNMPGPVFEECECGGARIRVLTKKQGSRVKLYRKALDSAGINYTEDLYINCPQIPGDFGPGQMVVVFAWEDKKC